jgi:hypothetical protein
MSWENMLKEKIDFNEIKKSIENIQSFIDKNKDRFSKGRPTINETWEEFLWRIESEEYRMKRGEIK